MSDNEKDQDKVEAEDTNPVEEAQVIELEAEEVVEQDGEQTVESVGESAEVAVDPSEMQPVVKQRSSLLPLLLGGVVAGAIGFGSATYLNFGGDSATEAKLAELTAILDGQSAEISVLADELERVEGLADFGALVSRVEQLSGSIEASVANSLGDMRVQIDAVHASIADLEKRMLDVEKRPMAETISEGAVEAYETEMAALREAIATHRADIEKIAEDARAMEAAARDDAVRSEGATWVSEINAALVDGTGFSGPISALESEGVSIPSDLKTVATNGVATQAELAEAFPVSAREALAAVRSDEAEGGQGSILAFLQNQVGARSVAPKDGDSADAILSRAEAATKSGDLSDALSEIASLPEAGQMAMAEWSILAQERVAALAAISELRETVLNK